MKLASRSSVSALPGRGHRAAVRETRSQHADGPAPVPASWTVGAFPRAASAVSLTTWSAPVDLLDRLYQVVLRQPGPVGDRQRPRGGPQVGDGRRTIQLPADGITVAR